MQIIARAIHTESIYPAVRLTMEYLHILGYCDLQSAISHLESAFNHQDIITVIHEHIFEGIHHQFVHNFSSEECIF